MSDELKDATTIEEVQFEAITTKLSIFGCVRELIADFKLELIQDPCSAKVMGKITAYDGRFIERTAELVIIGDEYIYPLATVLLALLQDRDHLLKKAK